MATWDLGAFSSYELGKVADAFRARAAEHPHAFAGHVLREACMAHLLVDQRYAEPWGDPTFMPRYHALRDRLLLPFVGQKPVIEVEAREVIAAIDALVAELEARDA